MNYLESFLREVVATTEERDYSVNSFFRWAWKWNMRVYLDPEGLIYFHEYYTLDDRRYPCWYSYTSVVYAVEFQSRPIRVKRILGETQINGQSSKISTLERETAQLLRNAQFLGKFRELVWTTFSHEENVAEANSMVPALGLYTPEQYAYMTDKEIREKKFCFFSMRLLTGGLLLAFERNSYAGNGLWDSRLHAWHGVVINKDGLQEIARQPIDRNIAICFSSQFKFITNTVSRVERYPQISLLP
ncbi:MAG: hypothetical protein NZ822_01275 [Patescibacteria group bacterium]|nr:hypothetical protein [Patescibacteria group bacterium]